MRIGITGVAGLQGSHLAAALLKDGHQVIGIDNLQRGGRERVPASVSLRTVDCRHYPAMLEHLKGCGTVYHLAAHIGGVEYIQHKSWACYEDNLQIDLSVFRACADLGVKTVIYPSSACAYPTHLQSTWDAVLKEDQIMDRPSPESGYGWGKFIGEITMAQLPIPNRVVFRLFNVYGAGESAAPGGHVVPELIRKVMLADEAFEVFGDGTAGRAFCHVDDAVDAYLRAASLKGAHTMNIGNPVPVRISELADLIVKASGKHVKPWYNQAKPTGVIGRTPDITLARKTLGWEPQVSMEEGIERTYAYYAGTGRRPQ